MNEFDIVRISSLRTRESLLLIDPLKWLGSSPVVVNESCGRCSRRVRVGRCIIPESPNASTAQQINFSTFTIISPSTFGSNPVEQKEGS